MPTLDIDIDISQPARSVPIATTTASERLFTRQCVVKGWSLCETTGAASAKVRIRDGGDAAGTVLTVITLLANESTRDWLGPAGIMAPSGVFLEVVSGSVEGAVWVAER